MLVCLYGDSFLRRKNSVPPYAYIFFVVDVCEMKKIKFRNLRMEIEFILCEDRRSQ